MQSDGSQVAVLFAHAVTVQQGAGVSVTGALPLVVVAATTVNLQGTVQSATPGNAGGPLVTQSGAGGGPGGGAGGNHQGAGGGGYCGTGGQGAVGSDAAAPAPGGRSYGTPALVPLIGGSAGGNHGDYDDGGEGGGAIQISAGTSITVGTLGVLNVPGYGGANVGGGGGGSGGGILLEAPQVTIDGIVTANGGGAGLATANASGSGQTGQPSLQPATGGDVTEGAGAAGAIPNGADGTASAGTRGQRRRGRRTHSHQYDRRRGDDRRERPRVARREHGLHEPGHAREVTRRHHAGRSYGLYGGTTCSRTGVVSLSAFDRRRRRWRRTSAAGKLASATVKHAISPRTARRPTR